MERREILVADTSELRQAERKIVSCDDTEIGVYRVNGRLYAYESLCAHQGGPACEGLFMPKVEEVLSEEKKYQSRRFNYDEWHIICPWHAWEYDVTTGEFVADRRFRLKRYEVIEKDGKIYILV